MSFFKTKRDLADKLWSEYVRKYHGACQLCGTTRNLTCSHYKGRRHENTRFDLENSDCFCVSCHNKMEHEKGHTTGEINGQKVSLPKLYTKWKMEQLGEKRYNALTLRANKTVKKDRKMQVIRIKELLNQLK